MVNFCYIYTLKGRYKATSYKKIHRNSIQLSFVMSCQNAADIELIKLWHILPTLQSYNERFETIVMKNYANLDFLKIISFISVTFLFLMTSGLNAFTLI